MDDVDSSAFDVKLYVESALKTQPLTSLLDEDDKLVHEIQSLDSDMQNLVHENYNKFISATDTIRKMKHNVEDMEMELHNLIANMDAMQDCSHSVNEKLSDQYVKVGHAFIKHLIGPTPTGSLHACLPAIPWRAW